MTITVERERVLIAALERIRDTAKSWEGRTDAPFWNLGDIAAAALEKAERAHTGAPPTEDER